MQQDPADGLSWVGYLGATASYLSTWFFLALSTLSHLSRPLADKADKADKEAYRAQQAVWHNLLAIWLWRYLISTVESITVPGLISVMGLILHYLPSYFLWMTAFFLGMMVTKKTREGNVSPHDHGEAQLTTSGHETRMARLEAEGVADTVAARKFVVREVAPRRAGRRHQENKWWRVDQEGQTE